jgi:hypothetical protein
MDLMSTLKTKVAGIPVWIIALIGVAGLAWYMQKHKAASTSSTTSTSQSGTDLTSASQLANMFTTAGLMPFQGGNTYVNTAQNNSQPTVVNAGYHQTLQSVVDWAKANGYPNFTWADLWALNPGLINGSTILNGPSGWYLTQRSTPITLSTPGTVQVGAGGISGDNPNKVTA